MFIDGGDGNFSPIEGDFNRLPAKVRAEIVKTEQQLTADLPPTAQARLVPFAIEGVEHKAYFVPHFDPHVAKEYRFVCLLY